MIEKENNSIFSYINYALNNFTIYKYKIIINYNVTNENIPNSHTILNIPSTENNQNTQNKKKQTNKTIITLYDMNRIVKYKEIYGDFTYLDILYYILLKLNYDIYENVYTQIQEKPLQLDFLFKETAFETYEKMLFYLLEE